MRFIILKEGSFKDNENKDEPVQLHLITLEFWAKMQRAFTYSPFRYGKDLILSVSANQKHMTQQKEIWK